MEKNLSKEQKNSIKRKIIIKSMPFALLIIAFIGLISSLIIKLF